MTLEDLEAVLRERRNTDPALSYTAELLTDPERIQRKIMEEAFEVCLELGRTENNSDLTAAEAADLIYHLIVGLVSVDVPIAEVFSVLKGRRA